MTPTPINSTHWSSNHWVVGGLRSGRTKLTRLPSLLFSRRLPQVFHDAARQRQAPASLQLPCAPPRKPPRGAAAAEPRRHPEPPEALLQSSQPAPAEGEKALQAEKHQTLIRVCLGYFSLLVWFGLFCFWLVFVLSY